MKKGMKQRWQNTLPSSRLIRFTHHHHHHPPPGRKKERRKEGGKEEPTFALVFNSFIMPFREKLAERGKGTAEGGCVRKKGTKRKNKRRNANEGGEEQKDRKQKEKA